LVQAVVGILLELSVLVKIVEDMIGCVEKVCIPDQVFESVFTLVQNELTHAVVGIFVLLSVFTRIVEDMRGCEEKVVIPLIVVVPLTVLVEELVPISIELVDKLVPILNVEEPLIVFTYKVDVFRSDALIMFEFKLLMDTVDAFRTETLVGPRVIEPVLGWMESIVEELAFKYLIIAVDTFKTEVLLLKTFEFMVVRLSILQVELFKKLIVEVELFKKLIVALETFNTETLIDKDCKLRMDAVELFKTETLVGAIVIDPPDKLDPIVIMEFSLGPMIFNTFMFDVLKSA
jgi:hypothetical protein